MNQEYQREVISILTEGRDLTLATNRPDGAPQATTVSYASEGLAIYFGCAASSQKARNLARDPRVSLTVNLPYQDWAQIRGVSLGGRARRVEEPAELDRVGLLFMRKFPEVAQYIALADEPPVMFRIDPTVISLLDYRKGFGHAETAEVQAA